MESINLKNFDIDNLMRDIQEKMPFYNERHFQCELGMAIRMQFKDDKNIDVLYEMYYNTCIPKYKSVCDKEADYIKTKRNYTDIVVCDTKTKEYIAIELKYALLGKSNNANEKRFIYSKQNGDAISVAKKGALDNSRYDFIFDVYRIECLKNSKSPYENCNLQKFVAGYAVMLSNAKTIWTTSDRTTNYKNFCIDDKNWTSGDYTWLGGINTNSNAVRPDITELKKKYYCTWKDYFKDAANISPCFKYLVIKVSQD